MDLGSYLSFIEMQTGCVLEVSSGTRLKRRCRTWRAAVAVLHTCPNEVNVHHEFICRRPVPLVFASALRLGSILHFLLRLLLLFPPLSHQDNMASTSSDTKVAKDVEPPATSAQQTNGSVEEEAGETQLIPDTGETSEGGKLKMIVQLLKRCLGVKDLAALCVLYFLRVDDAVANQLLCVTPCRRRLSLPASLLEPIPNLEYWHYLDRPDLFVSYVKFTMVRLES